jgi:hypothetical protein
MRMLLALFVVACAGCDLAPAEARSLEWDVSGPTMAATTVAPSARPSPGSSAAPAVVEAASAAVTVRHPAPCGTAGAKPCPLQAMMRGTLQAALMRDDFGALEGALSRLAANEPPGLSGWSDVALRGVEAARSHDKAGVQATCSGCHALFRDSFRASAQRGRPLR